ncbi:DUF6632 domain-containing protein [Gallaecimonas sp. GXIMD4217]|uniref:DUF6632 domain-containing protein n=1 Tax=Gallaecimonas sp. GXIMD4217 TaxID=3131927 RepID=UPI00311AFE7E
MDSALRLKLLRVALVVIGLIFLCGLFILMKSWPAAWTWEPRQSEYEEMLLGIYATLGVFLMRAARDPLANLGLIWFTVWSSLVHGAIMLIQALQDPLDRANLLGDVPGLLLVALVLAWLTPRQYPRG